MSSIVNIDQVLKRIADETGPKKDPKNDLIAEFVCDPFMAKIQYFLLKTTNSGSSFKSFSTKSMELKEAGYNLIANRYGNWSYLSDYSEETLLSFYGCYGDYVIGSVSLKEIHLLNSNWKKFMAQKSRYDEDYADIYERNWKYDNTKLGSGLLKEFVAGQRQAIAQNYAVNEDQPADVHATFDNDDVRSSFNFNTTGGGGGFTGLNKHMKPEPLTDRGKSPISEIVEENAWGGVPMQGHKSCRLLQQDVHKIGKVYDLGERDGGYEFVDLEMGLDPYMIIMYTEGKPKNGIQEIAKVFLAATFAAGFALANMAKGGSVSAPIYGLAVSAIAIGFLSSLAAVLTEEKYPKLAAYAGCITILAASVGFFSTFMV